MHILVQFRFPFGGRGTRGQEGPLWEGEQLSDSWGGRWNEGP